MSGRGQFGVALSCTHCGQTGHVVWEEGVAADRTRGAQRKLVRISGGFLTETGRTTSGGPIIVCDRCDQIQPD